MLDFYRLQDENAKSEEYINLRDIVLKCFPTATIQSTEEGHRILWCGIAISEISKTAYEAWLDVALPY